MKNVKNILRGILIIFIVIFISILMYLNAFPEKKEMQEANEKINTEQTVSLIKHAISSLTSSENLETNSIPNEEMITFALNYMQVIGGYNIKYTDSGMTASVNLEDIQQTVEYIFGKQINYDNVEYKIENDKITIPTFVGSTDLQIFKFKAKEYDKSNDEYIVYIDCLEPKSAADVSELIETSTVDYDKSDVLRTVVFKYKQLVDRKILLSYKKIDNI